MNSAGIKSDSFQSAHGVSQTKICGLNYQKNKTSKLVLADE
jgi:hypothetical protein